MGERKYPTPLEALKPLGDTARSIRDTLSHLGIRGTRLDVVNCPIAKYLRTCGFYSCTVNPTRIIADYAEDRHVLDTPPIISLFIRLFDMGAAPELEE